MTSQNADSMALRSAALSHTADSAVSSQASGVVHSLANLGTIIPLENGADQDVFFLAFDDVDGQSGAREGYPRLPFQQSLTGVEASDIGVRTFEEINTTIAEITGVSGVHLDLDR